MAAPVWLPPVWFAPVWLAPDVAAVVPELPIIAGLEAGPAKPVFPPTLGEEPVAVNELPRLD